MDKQKHEQLIAKSIEDSCAVKKLVAEQLGGRILEAAALMAGTIRAGGKILICGNGGSAADAQHFAAELVGRYFTDREPYAAAALTTDTSIITCCSNDFGFDAIFERQVLALGKKGDVLVAISTSGNSPNILKAIEAAAKTEMKTVSLTGKTGGKMAAQSDILLNVPSDFTPRIQESHGLIIHILCELIENIIMNT